MAIFVHHPAQYPSTAIVVEIGVDIGQVDTVWIEETLKKQIIFQGVYLRDAQAISHHRARRRTTSRTYHHVQFLPGSPDEVAYDEEVARETHGLHHVQLKIHPLPHLFWQRVAIKFGGSLVGQFGQIVGLQLDAVYLFVTAQRLYLALPFLWRQGVFPILVRGELLQQLLPRDGLH